MAGFRFTWRLGLLGAKVGRIGIASRSLNSLTSTLNAPRTEKVHQDSFWRRRRPSERTCPAESRGPPVTYQSLASQIEEQKTLALQMAGMVCSRRFTFAGCARSCDPVI